MSKAVQPTGSQHDCEIGEQNPMSRKNDPLISLVVACLDPLPELQYDGGEHPVITESIVYAVQAPRDRDRGLASALSPLLPRPSRALSSAMSPPLARPALS